MLKEKLKDKPQDMGLPVGSPIFIVVKLTKKP
jgi:hypothetical protein